MNSLASTLAEVRKRILQVGSKGLNEQNTKASLIEPVLRALGWNTEDFDEVALEYRVKSRDKPVDYGLLLMRTPRLFVEAKGLGHSLDDRKWANQIMGYAAVAGVEWIVLTNGNEYRIYNAHALVHVDEKLFRKITIASDDPLVQPTLELLAKDRMEENRLEVFWRAEFVDRQVKAVLDATFTVDGDMLLVNHIATQAKNLTAEEIRASLRRCRATFEFPVPAEPGPTPPPPLPPPPRVLSELIQARVLHAPVALERTYKGKTLRARVEKDGRVRFEGKLYDSPSMAGAVARASVIGMNAKGKPPATNGWSFWQYTTPEGRRETLADARERFSKRRADDKQAAG